MHIGTDQKLLKLLCLYPTLGTWLVLLKHGLHNAFFSYYLYLLGHYSQNAVNVQSNNPYNACNWLLCKTSNFKSSKHGSLYNCMCEQEPDQS